MGNYLKSLFQKAAEEGLLNPFPDERALSHIVFTVESITETLYLVKDRQLPLTPIKDQQKKSSMNSSILS